jgi:CheY-like chemotaxis protein
VETILVSDGYKILVANSPAHAAEMCRTYRAEIDVLLTDVVMPGMSGPELAADLLTLRPGLRVVYMSGYAGEYLNDEGVSAEGVSLLQKPFTAAALEEKICQVLNATIVQ